MNILSRVVRKLKNLLENRQNLRHELVGPMNLWKLKRDFQIKFLHDQDLKKSNKFLDLGCGTLRGGIPIIDFLDSKNYYGIDVRKNVLAKAKKELRFYGLGYKLPKLIHFTNYDQLEIKEKFDIIFAFSVLIHMSDAIVEECFQFVSKQLETNGVFFANVNLGAENDVSWQGFPVVFRDLDFYESLAERNNLKLENMGTLLSLGHYSGNAFQDNQIMLKIFHA